MKAIFSKHYFINQFDRPMYITLWQLNQWRSSEAKAKDTQKKFEAKAKDTQKNSRPRPRTALSRTDPLEAKDRNACRLGPETQAQVFSKKRVIKIFFRRSPKKSLQKNIFGVFQNKTSTKIIFHAIYKFLTIQKIVLSSSREQGNFRGLEASRPRPRPRTWPSRPRSRTSKCVLEAKDVFKDSTSGKS